MEEILIPLKELAKEVTIPQLKYWAKLLGILLIVRGRIAHVSNGDAQKLVRTTELVREGKSPQEAAEIIGVPSQDVVPLPSSGASPGILDLNEKIEKLERRNEGIEKALLAMVEEMKNLRRENSALKQLLSPPVEPVKKFTPWRPEQPKDPLEGLNWVQKALVQIFEPQKMRQYDC